METIEESSTKSNDEMSISPSPENLRICLLGCVVDDNSIVEAAKTFGVPVLTSETGLEILTDNEWTTYFVMKEFDGPIYEAIHKSKHRIMGPPALVYAAKMKDGLIHNARPIYNYSMKGVITCFTGIRKKDELTKLVKLIHSMGGGIRKDMNSKVTHLISNVSGGEKYQYAKTFRLTVLRSQWVHDAWEKRDEPQFLATAEDFTRDHKLKAFEGQKICFFGFPPDEHQHMLDVLRSNGGVPAELDDPDCSHVVVDEHFAQAKPEPKNSRTHILKSDWFWYTIQNGYADEMDYLFGDYLDSIANTPNTDRRDSLPISFNKRKRKRFSQRLQLEGTPIGSGKRRSSVSDAGLLSVSGSFFDSTASPDKIESAGKLISEPESATEQTPKNKSMRFNHFMDFFSTESNYVGILDTIVHLFKNPLEEKAECSDALLNKSEIRAIFGNFIPIHEVHQRMLECLRDIHTKWREDCSIGEIILHHRDELIKAYPPYVNFFEQMKECLIHCDTQNPRFHAFLKINQAKPECGRQTLQDLMIRPVQRLPSISLLLNDILKHTNKNNPDYQKLEEALKAIKEVMAHINEDKRKTEGRMAIFDIFNDIEGCPAHLVSSNRSFISKCEVTELSDNLSGRGDTLMLYLFSDTIEVCKKRSRGFNSAKSPSTTKCFKHIKLMSLNAIRFVIDITDSPRAFAILCRQDKDKLHSFTIADEEIDKVVYLKTLCKQMAENACRTDTDKSLLFRTSQELEVDISDVNLSTLSKAFKLAARTRLKVGRAFSFNKTPSKLKRAVSTMMTSPFGSTNSLTPASQLAQMRLASCTNINEVVGEEDSRCGSPTSQSEVLVAPLSIQPTRKAKSSTMSMAALRRI
ncbi:protein ECT2 isoform X5 [Episyrphus balteatus]|uniref:protein ECT2 isoform X5 n=1 Tax=Episyrphus balteatus TaxID=286459 RepID=UPI0024866CF3|nr:protein ECT2 isoform X5 [Episyrphus balteatus]